MASSHQGSPPTPTSFSLALPSIISKEQQEVIPPPLHPCHTLQATTEVSFISALHSQTYHSHCSGHFRRGPRQSYEPWTELLYSQGSGQLTVVHWSPWLYITGRPYSCHQCGGNHQVIVIKYLTPINGIKRVDGELILNTKNCCCLLLLFSQHVMNQQGSTF